MNGNITERYRDRFRKVLEYIDANLAGDLSIERLSSIAGFSKYHFHRQFSGLVGLGVYRYVQLRRLKRASYQLAYREQSPIVDIALDSGYSGPEAFARAFRRQFGQSPTEFRDQPQWKAWYETYEPLRKLVSPFTRTACRADQVEIIHFPMTRVAALEYRGDARLIGHALRSFIAWRKENRLPPAVSATFNIVHHHPAGEPDGHCHYDLCAQTERKIPDNPLGIVAKVIPAGRCARLRYIGRDERLEDAVRFLYADWLPGSGEELRDFPLFLQRIRFFPETPEHEAVTDVFLPLAESRRAEKHL